MADDRDPIERMKKSVNEAFSGGGVVIGSRRALLALGATEEDLQPLQIDTDLLDEPEEANEGED